MKNLKYKIAKLLRDWSTRLDPEFCPVNLPPVDPGINLRSSVYDIDRVQVCMDIKAREVRYVSADAIGAHLSEKIADAMLANGTITITRTDNPDGSCRFLAEAFVGKKQKRYESINF